ncbi:MAG: hypothetical protein WBG01_12195 [Bacteroidota bacterium]
MKERWLRDHLLGILLVVGVMVLLAAVTEEPRDDSAVAREQAVRPYLDLEFLDLGNPLHRAMFRETLALYYPREPGRADSILRAIDSHRQEQFTTEAFKTGAQQRGLTLAKLVRLTPMYLKFVLVFAIVLALSTYGAQTLGTYRFVRAKQRRLPSFSEFISRLRGLWTEPGWKGKLRNLVVSLQLLIKSLVKVIAYAVLFAPAYVVAYSLKTRFETDGYLFMVTLAVVSNGLLVTYANKFYTFLVHEDSKGYVDTARVKNLNASYAWNTPEGIAVRSILMPRKSFPGHLLNHITMNARFQYILTVKEQATFLITGLVIIEMALNIQGHFCYELMQNILYRDYEVVLAIIVALFILVKATDIAVDALFRYQSHRFGSQREDA